MNKYFRSSTFKVTQPSKLISNQTKNIPKIEDNNKMGIKRKTTHQDMNVTETMVFEIIKRSTTRKFITNIDKFCT